MKSLKFFFFNFLKLAGLWLVGEVVAIYGSKVAEGFSAFQRRSCCLLFWFLPISFRISLLTLGNHMIAPLGNHMIAPVPVNQPGQTCKLTTLEEETYKNVATLYIFPPLWRGTVSSNHSSCKTRTSPSYIVKIMGANVLATEGARASAAMILTRITLLTLAQRAGNKENVTIWWHHHVVLRMQLRCWCVYWVDVAF